MEDVEITDVNDDGSPYQAEKAPIRNQDLTSLSLTVGELMSQYGWYLLLGTLLLYLLIQYLSKRRSSQSRSPPQTLQDAVLGARRQEAMEAARIKMQEELDAKAGIFREKQKQQEEEKRRQKIEIWESMQQGKSYKRTAKPCQTTGEASSSTTEAKPKPDKKPLRSADYSPLSGQGGGSCSWRPDTKKGPSAGG
ncbi:selenoprotein S [Cottoperca gobio]|uniref:Selenoprotein S n=1 Tax=Cottoperca gobio TaxID=56716 RepID=A0A6J2RJ09_COTGO|nr:selenoprotein S [Cottoperca gobio]